MFGVEHLLGLLTDVEVSQLLREDLSVHLNLYLETAEMNSKLDGSYHLFVHTL